MIRRHAGPFILASSLLTGCSDRPDPPSNVGADDPYVGRGMLAAYQDPFPATTAPDAFDLAGGVPAARVNPIDTRRRHELTSLIDAIALSENIEPALVHAVIAQESAYNPTAGSPKGAIGLMQLMSATAARFGLTAAERYDAAKNVRAGIRYLKWLTKKFGHLDLVLAGYNAGEGAVLKYGRQIPPYPETQTYVRRVKGFLAHYRQGQRHRQSRTLLAEANERRPLQRARVGQRAREHAQQQADAE